MAKIQLKFQDKVEKEIPIFKPYTSIGRFAENDIFIENVGVSRLHAQIIQENDTFWVEDLGSDNGILVNGQETKKAELKDHDEIKIGKHKLIFLLHAAVTPEEIKAFQEKSEEILAHYKPHIEAETISELKVQTKGRKLTPSGFKTEVKEAGVEVLEGGVDQTVVKCTRIFTVAGKGPTVDIRIKGHYDKDVLFVIRKMEDGYYISPKAGAIKIDSQEVIEYTKLKDGNVIEAGETKLKFFLVF